MEDRAHFQATLQLAKGLLHIQQAFVVRQHLFLAAGFCQKVGVEQIPPIPLGFLPNEFPLFFPFQPPLRADAVAMSSSGTGRRNWQRFTEPRSTGFNNWAAGPA